MLAIRMQRTGRKGHAQFRVIVQDSRAHPKGGRVVAYAGSYNPYTKVAQLDSELIGGYLGNGAQPSDRVARLLKKEGVKLPAWYKLAPPKKRAPKKAKEPATAPASEATAPPIKTEETLSEESEKPAKELTEEKATDTENQPAEGDKTETPAESAPEPQVSKDEPVKVEATDKPAESEKTDSA